MNDDGLLLLILAAIAGFLLFRLRNVLGDRSGLENTENYSRGPAKPNGQTAAQGDGNVVPMKPAVKTEDDSDIFSFTEIDTELGQALKQIKTADPEFNVKVFMEGARAAYEMLLMAFETGDKATLKDFLSPEVFELFSSAIDDRNARGLSVDVRFVGIRSAEPTEAAFDPSSMRADVTVRYAAEIIMAARNAQGELVEGDPAAVRRINDVWTYSRIMASSDPNWTLVATGA